MRKILVGRVVIIKLLRAALKLVVIGVFIVKTHFSPVVASEDFD